MRKAERARSRELISTVIWEIKTPQYLKIRRFFRCRLYNNIFFYHLIDIYDKPVRPGPTLPDPAVTPFDGLFLSQFNRLKLKILTLHGYRF